jgi:uncharacterized protein YfiM (DUF2279 family)
MRTLLYLCIVVLFATQAFAYEINVGAEAAHAAGGAAIAGVATAVANNYWPEHRALIGFGISTAVGIIGEGIDRAQTGEKFSHMFEDVAFHTLGAAIGSLITDKFILIPVIKQDNSRSNYYGLAFQYLF